MKEVPQEHIEALLEVEKLKAEGKMEYYNEEEFRKMIMGRIKNIVQI